MAKSYLGGSTIISTGSNLSALRSKRSLQLRATHPDPLSPEGAELLRMFGKPEAPPAAAPRVATPAKKQKKDNGFPRTLVAEFKAEWERDLLALAPNKALFIPSVNVACTERFCGTVTRRTGRRFVVKRWTGPKGKIGVNVWRKA